MRESLTLGQLDDEIRQLAATLRNTRNVSLQQRSRHESLAETSYGRAIQCIHEGPGRRQEVMAGKFDRQIHTLFTSYLASKYPGASQESIQHHAASHARRIRSFVRVGAWNTAGTAVSTLLTTVAPKLGLALGFNASALGAGLGITIGSALVPTILASLPIAGALGATYVARRMTRDSRESRKAGNILHKVLHEGPELRKFRAAIAGGTDIFKQFDELIKKSDRIPEKYSNWLWMAGMVGVAGVLGTYGAGSYDIAQKVMSPYPTWFEAFGDWQKVWGEFSSQFFYKDAANPGAWQTGVRELNDLGKYVLTHAGAIIGLNPVPDWKNYISGYPR